MMDIMCCVRDAAKHLCTSLTVVLLFACSEDVMRAQNFSQRPSEPTLDGGASGQDSASTGNDAGVSNRPDTGATSAADAGNMYPDAEIDCDDRKRAVTPWPQASTRDVLRGQLEFAQTHVNEPGDTRYAPQLLAKRSALLLFTPERNISGSAALFVRVKNQNSQSIPLVLNPPSKPLEILEQGLTDVALQAYSTDAFHAVLPWNWIQEGYKLEIAYLESDTLYVFEHTFIDLSAPNEFTVTRAKMVLFGEEDFDTSTRQSDKILREFYGSVPAATMRWVDYLPWRLNQVVITTTQGPQLIQSEAEHDYYTDNDHHWSIIKNQFALRLNLSNTGRGLNQNRAADGDNSPYSFGTSVGMGWFRRPDGEYQDLDDAPWAAGWTGWTAMWADECGNAFIHEVGHSFTLAHFTEGTGVSWGIADQYPSDGVSLETHPWGYNHYTKELRTWYRVDRDGPVLSQGGAFVGKRDPMNGGEPTNSLTCFPQYTGYHAWKAQNWMNSQPTIMKGPQGPGIYRWDFLNHSYVREAAPSNAQEPIAVGVPIVTLIGTLGRNIGTSQTYPALFAPSGNVFEMPDPFGNTAPDSYRGGQYFLEIQYLTGEVEYALIAQTEPVDDQVYLYALNLSLTRAPTLVKLHRAHAAYPNIQQGQSTVIHTRTISVPDLKRFTPVLTIGKGALANASTKQVTRPCEEAVNCEDRKLSQTWRRQKEAISEADSALSFILNNQDPPQFYKCSDFDSISTQIVRVENESGQKFNVLIHAQRVVNEAGQRQLVHANDRTDWSQAPDLEQSLDVWLPYSETATLPPGKYQSDKIPVRVYASSTAETAELSQSGVTLNFEVFDVQPINLSNGEFVSPSMRTDDSSMYFLPRDPEVGPNSRVWWNDSDPEPIILRVPAKSTTTGQDTYLNIRAQHQSCGNSRRDLHAGEASRDCAHEVVLFMNGSDNLHLTSGQQYITYDSMPLVIDGRRWHEPNNHDLVGTVAVQVIYQP